MPFCAAPLFCRVGSARVSILKFSYHRTIPRMAPVSRTIRSAQIGGRLAGFPPALGGLWPPAAIAFAVGARASRHSPHTSDCPRRSRPSSLFSLQMRRTGRSVEREPPTKAVDVRPPGPISLFRLAFVGLMFSRSMGYYRSSARKNPVKMKIIPQSAEFGHLGPSAGHCG